MTYGVVILASGFVLGVTLAVSRMKASHAPQHPVYDSWIHRNFDLGHLTPYSSKPLYATL